MNETNRPGKPKRMAEPLAAKHRARKRLIQALYQTHYNHMRASEVIEQFLLEQDFSKVDVDFFKHALNTVEKRREEFQAVIDAHLGRNKADMGAVENAILLLAVYELAEHLETPFKVVINEAVLLARDFGGEGSHTFINGLLHQVCKQLRDFESP